MGAAVAGVCVRGGWRGSGVVRHEGVGVGVAAVRLSLPDAWKREDAPTLAAKIVHYTPYLCSSMSICRTL